MSFSRHLYALVIAASIPCGSVLAEDLPAPSGDVLLTVSGIVPVTNVGDMAQFDMALLKSLGSVSIVTTTPWTTGQQNFTGISLKALLDRLEVRGGKLSAKAINDYAVELPFSDAIEGGPIVAYLHNGQEMSVRDKGPLWIVYPFDAKSEYQAEVIYSRSIWQLDRIVLSE